MLKNKLIRLLLCTVGTIIPIGGQGADLTAGNGIVIDDGVISIDRNYLRAETRSSSSGIDKDSYTLGAGAIASGYDSIAIGNSSAAHDDYVVSFGHKRGDPWGGGSPVFLDTVYRKLTNVADGVDDHDVTTVGQVKAMVAASSNSGVTYTAGNGIKISDKNQISISRNLGENSNIDISDSSSYILGDGSKILTRGDDNPDYYSNLYQDHHTENNFIVGNNSKIAGSNSIVLGNNAKTVSDEAMAIGNGAYVGIHGLSSLALGYKAGAFGYSSLALGRDSVAFEDEVVSFGHKASDKYADSEDDIYKSKSRLKSSYDSDLYRRLINVADGIDDHDVTTLGQVKKLVTQAGGASITGSDDVTISDNNIISIAKNGQITAGDSGIVTGDTVYQVTNKLNAALTDQNTSITAATNKISSLNTSMEKLRNSMVQMNTSISDTIADLPNSLGNFINKDLSNLSTDGQNTLKALIKSEIKNQMGTSASNSVSAVSTMDNSFMVQATADTSYVDNVVAGKADKAELNKLADTVATKADKKDLDALANKVDTKADKTYVDSELAKKADQSTVDAISTNVDTNTKNIASNSEAIKGNTSAIANLKENKADISGANIDITSWSEKLGTGKVAKDDAGLVTGGTVFSALEQKADIGYVNAGFQSMGAQMQEMNQSLTRNINKVGAGAAALAGLHPQEYDPNNKLDFAVGYGHYHNANATALGMYYRPNAVTTLSLAGTIGNGDPMLSAGLSFKLGMGKHVEKVMVTKEEFNAMQNRLVDQDNKLADQKKEMANQRDRINQQDQEMMAQKEKIEQLEVMVKQLMAK